MGVGVAEDLCLETFTKDIPVPTPYQRTLLHKGKGEMIGTEPWLGRSPFSPAGPGIQNLEPSTAWGKKS